MCEQEYKTKYETLLNILFTTARLSTITRNLYTVDDDVYAVVRALEPERYEARVKELEL